MPERLDALIATLPFLAPLRPDELCRAAKRFRVVDLAAGETRTFGAESGEALVVVEGRIAVEATPLPNQPPLFARLQAGDHLGAVAVAAGRPTRAKVLAEKPSRLAILDAPGYAALEQEFPAVAIPACAALAEELAWKDDLLREVASVDAERLSGDERNRALEARRARVAARLAHCGRRAILGAGWREAARAAVREPAFWMLFGFLAAFGGARAMVHYILSHHKQEQLFALHHVKGFQNPIHIHHFNYGLILVTITSLLAFFPAFRRHLLVMALIFGVGAGLIFDEFALIWNLNPDYYQGLSRDAVLVVALALGQLAFLRPTWGKLFRRLGRARRVA